MGSGGAQPPATTVNDRPTGGVILDDTDKAIVRELQGDGRVSYADLGPRVGLSQAAVRQRVRRLIDSGTIQIVAVTDPTSLGFHVFAMLGVRVRDDVRRVAADLGAIDAVDYVVITAGRFDILVEVVCEDNGALLELVNDRIRAVAGVETVEIFNYLDLVKQTYNWGTR